MLPTESPPLPLPIFFLIFKIRNLYFIFKFIREFNITYKLFFKVFSFSVRYYILIKSKCK